MIMEMKQKKMINMIDMKFQKTVPEMKDNQLLNYINLMNTREYQNLNQKLRILKNNRKN